jgi:hypothetical protein
MNRTTTMADISDILLLVENFPINNRLEIDLDAKVSVKDKKEIIERLGMDSKLLSFRDIINLLTNFIKGIYSTDAKIASVDRLDELRKIGARILRNIYYLIFVWLLLREIIWTQNCSWDMLLRLLVLATNSTSYYQQ